MSAMLLYIITNAVMFAFVLTSEQIPQAMSAWISDMGLGKIGFLLAVNLILLVVGMVMEPSAIVLIMAPIMFPVAVKLGVDPIHFGIMMVVNMITITIITSITNTTTITAPPLRGGL